MPPVPCVTANLVVKLDSEPEVSKTEMVEENMKQSDQEDSSEISNCRNLTCFLRTRGT